MRIHIIGKARKSKAKNCKSIFDKIAKLKQLKLAHDTLK